MPCRGPQVNTLLVVAAAGGDDLRREPDRGFANAKVHEDHRVAHNLFMIGTTDAGCD